MFLFGEPLASRNSTCLDIRPWRVRYKWENVLVKIIYLAELGVGVSQSPVLPACCYRRAKLQRVEALKLVEALLENLEGALPLSEVAVVLRDQSM